jgi:autotransporter-associated beta strand protein
MRPRPGLSGVSLALFTIALDAAAPSVAQTTYYVSHEGSLRDALSSANPGDLIVLEADVTLTAGDLSSMATSVTIDGTADAVGCQFVHRSDVAHRGRAARRRRERIRSRLCRDHGGRIHGRSERLNQRLGSLSGDGTVTLRSGMLTTGGNNASTIFSGAIGGTGGVVKSGSGALVLPGANTYSGGTFINAGTLVGTASSVQGIVFDNTTLSLGGGADGTSPRRPIGRSRRRMHRAGRA